MVLAGEPLAVAAPASQENVGGACPVMWSPPYRDGDMKPADVGCRTQRFFAAPPAAVTGAPGAAPPAMASEVFSLPSMPAARGATTTVREDVPMPAAVAPAALAGEPRNGRRRWSADAWAYLRGGAGAATLGGMTPVYGASQYGVVVRRAFGSAPRSRAFAYLRIAGAADGMDRQTALGIGLRPLRGLPVAVLAEGRLQQDLYGTRLRPAAALVSELPPQALPFGFTGEVYGQAGWVGGAGATPFYDVQALADRGVLQPWRGIDLRLGAGVWSGGQRDAVRLDIGPRASVRTTVRGWPVRVAADWRFRVAGRAAPGSGPALTLSTGF